MSNNLLATHLEEDSTMRRLARDTQQVTKWKNVKLIGVASCDAAALNATLLTYVAKWWTGIKAEAQAIPIEVIRSEASGWPNIH